MSGELRPAPGDQANVSVLVTVPQAAAFRVFTEEIDAWWRRGLRYRVAGARRGIIRLEPGVGGRLLESFEGEHGPRVVQTGEVTCWDPPSRVVLRWRNVNFAPDEHTEVEVLFAATRSGTLVTVIHRGWSTLRPDHPARHGLGVQAFVRMTGMWWGELVSALREHAERGEGAVGG
jgi:uncharacterized protein YndB with AHSA1/START domain